MFSDFSYESCLPPPLPPPRPQVCLLGKSSQNGGSSSSPQPTLLNLGQERRVRVNRGRLRPPPAPAPPGKPGGEAPPRKAVCLPQPRSLKAANRSQVQVSGPTGFVDKSAASGVDPAQISLQTGRGHSAEPHLPSRSKKKIPSRRPALRATPGVKSS